MLDKLLTDHSASNSIQDLFSTNTYIPSTAILRLPMNLYVRGNRMRALHYSNNTQLRKRALVPITSTEHCVVFCCPGKTFQTGINPFMTWFISHESFNSQSMSLQPKMECFPPLLFALSRFIGFVAQITP